MRIALLCLASAFVAFRPEAVLAKTFVGRPAPLGLFASASPSEVLSALPEAPSPAVIEKIEKIEPVEQIVNLPGAIVSAVVPQCSGELSSADPSQWGVGVSPSCGAALNPYHRFLNTTTPIPLTPRQKARLALRNLYDPGNLVTIVGTSAFTIGTDAHTAFGPGWRGFGRNTGTSLLQDATGEFFGVFLIPSLTHQDPHYHRMPNATIPRRVLHAVSRTMLAQTDTGGSMPNYATLLTYPISAEITNLYVPGVRGNGPSTVARVLTGYATDPIDNLITEFLPDVARHIHVQVIFVQRILNQVAADEYVVP